jgi:hypothetical protein
MHIRQGVSGYSSRAAECGSGSGCSMGNSMHASQHTEGRHGFAPLMTIFILAASCLQACGALACTCCFL